MARQLTQKEIETITELYKEYEGITITSIGIDNNGMYELDYIEGLGGGFSSAGTFYLSTKEMDNILSA